MSGHYVARIVYRDGVPRYLRRGKFTDDMDRATRYPYPREARRQLDWVLRNAKCIHYTDVIDTRDPERTV